MAAVASLKPSLSALELLRQGLQAGYDLEDIAEHYKEKIQEEAAAIMKNTQHKELKEQIQKDLHNLAVIDRNKFITPRNCPLFSDLSPRSFLHHWSAVSHPSQRAIYLRHVSVTKCPLFSDLSPRSFFHHWSAASHPSQRAIYLRHVSVTKCPLFSDLSPRSLFPYVVPMYYLCIPYVFPMSLYLSFSLDMNKKPMLSK